MSFCLEQHLQQSEDYKILIKNTGFKEAKKVIEKHSPKKVYVAAGEKILGARIIGIPPIPIGINESESKVYSDSYLPRQICFSRQKIRKTERFIKKFMLYNNKYYEII